MKTIKVHFLDFWESFDHNNNLFINILRKRYHVELDEHDPDFLFYSPLYKPFEYMKYDCPRIMFTGEFLSPDFTAFDYFIGYDDISFGDRAFRFPLFLYDTADYQTLAKPITRDQAWQYLKEKEYFCNYIFGHDTALGIREKILEELSKYKRVECAGKHRNNMPNGMTYDIRSKMPFMEKCKFSITAESVCYPGFTSEKIGHAFETHSIPIYFGDPDVHKDFNTKAFIDYSSFNSVEDLVNKVIEIDQNDDMYIDMLCQFRYNQIDFEEQAIKNLENFLYNIVEQDRDAAYRRPRYYRAEMHESYLRGYNRLYEYLPFPLMKKLGKPHIKSE